MFVTDDARCCYHDHEAEDVTTAIVEYSGPSSSDSGVGDGSEEALCQLVTDVIDTVEEFEDEADGFEPSELRVCVDSLVPLLQQYDTEDVFRFVHVTTARIEQARGMGHYHLPVSRDHDAISYSSRCSTPSCRFEPARTSTNSSGTSAIRGPRPTGSNSDVLERTPAPQRPARPECFTVSP